MALLAPPLDPQLKVQLKSAEKAMQNDQSCMTE